MATLPICPRRMEAVIGPGGDPGYREHLCVPAMSRINDEDAIDFSL